MTYKNEIRPEGSIVYDISPIMEFALQMLLATQPTRAVACLSFLRGFF